jgi:RNA polymerase sigma factor (sigma-70 family)
MTATLSSVVSDIFDRGANGDRFATVADEQTAISAAKAGDEGAQIALMLAYAPALRNAVKWYTRAMPSVAQSAELEDVRAQAIVGLLEAIRAFDPEVHDRLAAIVSDYVTSEVSAQAADATGFAVPERTLKRFFGILRAADGNVFEATRLAPRYEMKRETFLAVLSAVRNVDSIDGLGAGEDEEAPRELAAMPLAPVYSDEEIVEDRILVEAAFRAVDDQEALVCRDYYGFSEYDTMSDAEIAHRRGLSRPKVQRVRSTALGKMRSALGVA